MQQDRVWFLAQPAFLQNSMPEGCGLRLWSSEEEGLWGSRSFANDLPDGVTVSNYLNLDMAGVNYPEDYAFGLLGPRFRGSD